MQIRLHVHPGVSRTRQGVAAVTQDSVEVCVPATARDSDATQAVVQLLSEALEFPKSPSSLKQGLKSRSKTVKRAGSSGSWVGGTCK